MKRRWPFTVLGGRIRRWHRQRRARRAAQALPEALALMESALRAGLSLPQAFEAAAEERTDRLGLELAGIVAALRTGRPMEESLAILEARLPAEEISLLCQSIEVLRRCGGNLAETFRTLRTTIEDRQRLERRIAALTSQGVFQAITLLALPWLLLLLLRLMAPAFVAPLTGSRLGMALLLAMIALEAAGAAWLRSIVLVRV